MALRVRSIGHAELRPPCSAQSFFPATLRMLHDSSATRLSRREDPERGSPATTTFATMTGGCPVSIP